ncbi:MAG TPA: hypothetical protein VEI97_02765 [bacterium]|nr:hypothetical protein [bacterium]
MEFRRTDGPVVWTDVIEMILTTRGIDEEELAQRVHATPTDIRNWAMELGEPDPAVAGRLLALLPHDRHDGTAP